MSEQADLQAVVNTVKKWSDKYVRLRGATNVYPHMPMIRPHAA